MSWRTFEFFAPREDGPLAIAHRGGAGEGAENSLEAFRRATVAGLRYVEIDLRGSADGTQVAWHGKGLERLRPRRRLDLARFDPDGVVLFEHVLEELPRDTRFFVDLKDVFAGEALARVLRRTRSASRVCIGSFSHARTTRAVAAVARETGSAPCTAMTPRQVAALLARAAGRPGAWAPPAASVQIPAWLATRRVVETAHRAGALVVVWTVNVPDAMRRLLDVGVDGLMTDYPTVLKRVLVERGEWPGRVDPVP